MTTKDRIAVVALIVVTAGASFYYGNQHSYTRGYNTGKKAQYTVDQAVDQTVNGAANNLDQQAEATQINRYNSLVTQYNALSDNYNSLRSAVIRYVGNAGSYQPSAHLSCTSNTIGSYTYTNCN